jgi:hypothetical protein
VISIRLHHGRKNTAFLLDDISKRYYLSRMANYKYSYLLRFDVEDKNESALYKRIHDAACDNGRSINKEILQKLQKAYGVKK